MLLLAYTTKETKTMAEEKQPEVISESIGLDDMSVLRTLLHNIKGISPVSSGITFTDTDDDQA